MIEKPEIFTKPTLDITQAFCWLEQEGIMTEDETNLLWDYIGIPRNDDVTIISSNFYGILNDTVDIGAKEDENIIRLYKLFKKEFPVEPYNLKICW